MMKTKIIFALLVFNVASSIAQQKSNKYTNAAYLFTLTSSNEAFENPEEQGNERIKTFRFWDLKIDITIQPAMTLEDAKRSTAVMSANLKARSKTYNENKYIAMIENADGKLLYMKAILIGEKYTYFININKPIDFEQGISQIEMFEFIK